MILARRLSQLRKNRDIIFYGKPAAIDFLSRVCEIDPGDMVAFGDDHNDMEMLSLCGRGIAVANAVPEVLAISDETTLSNDEDGVACWLEDNCL